jgi:succinate dehydrogenase / fumarate reductase cytochrome b subunit
MEVQTIRSISAWEHDPRAAKHSPFRWALSSLTRQYVMAITGLGLVLFVVVHMAGNLLIFAGRDALNAYAHSLDEHPGLLWLARALLLIAFAVHIVIGTQLTVQDRAARPVPYVRWKPLQSSWAARHMLLTGLLVLAFVIYHLLHFTFGATDRKYFKYTIPRDPQGYYDVTSMVVGGFSQTPVAMGYVAAQIILGLHLAHGAWSWFQHLGLNRENRLFLPSDRLKTRTRLQLLRPDRRSYARLVHGFGAIMTLLVILGNCSIPVAIQLGWRPSGYEEQLPNHALSSEWSPLP